MRSLDPEVEERNYAKAPLTKAELEEIVAVAGVENVINTRHAIAKTRDWRTKPPTKSAFVDAALEDNNLIRRPIVIAGDRAVVGYDEAALKKLFKGRSG